MIVFIFDMSCNASLNFTYQTMHVFFLLNLAGFLALFMEFFAISVSQLHGCIINSAIRTSRSRIVKYFSALQMAWRFIWIPILVYHASIYLLFFLNFRLFQFCMHLQLAILPLGLLHSNFTFFLTAMYNIAILKSLFDFFAKLISTFFITFADLPSFILLEGIFRASVNYLIVLVRSNHVAAYILAQTAWTPVPSLFIYLFPSS